ncbi:hypothetical protein [Streptomyces lushanensis]|uniref:hypothetical protein n=1 Tax=Streptomyces lushanensis TaxID=1434255 RepID=UPI001FE1D9D6|nr:hypothetical protein [Streptomyces lushanensis]
MNLDFVQPRGRQGRRTPFTATALSVLALLGAGGCTGSGDDGSPPSSSPVTMPATPPPTGAGAAGAGSVSEAPPPLRGGEILLTAKSRRGNAALPLARKIGDGLLGAQVNCRGTGTLSVSVEPVGLSFSLDCVAQEVRGTSNEIDLKRTPAEGTVRITAPSAVTWALTVEQ